jgi:hypothetical protein
MEWNIQISLRLYSSACKGDQISEALGVNSTKQFDKDEFVSRRAGINSKKREESLWILTSPATQINDFHSAIVAFLELIEFANQKNSYLSLSCQAEIKCTFNPDRDSINNSLSIPNDILTRLANAAIDLQFDFF